MGDGPKRVDRRGATGRAGETEAERMLRRAGLQILDRRWRSRAGEIDLVARDGETLVFVEVKTRTGAGFGDPRDAVDPGKRRRLARVAAAYLQAEGGSERLCRFDVVEVLPRERGAARIRHWIDAFRLWRSG